MLSLLLISCAILRPLTTTFEVLLTLKSLLIILSLTILIYFQMFSRASSDFYLKRKNRNLHFLGSSEFMNNYVTSHFLKYLVFVWLHWVLAVAREVFDLPCGTRALLVLVGGIFSCAI